MRTSMMIVALFFLGAAAPRAAHAIPGVDHAGADRATLAIRKMADGLQSRVTGRPRTYTVGSVHTIGHGPLPTVGSIVANVHTSRQFVVAPSGALRLKSETRHNGVYAETKVVDGSGRLRSTGVRKLP